MRSSATIKIQYAQTIAQAKQLEECAQSMQDIRKQLDALVDDLRGGWAGESADLYFQKCGELSQKLTKSGKDLYKTADVIERSAKAYRDAELAAIQLIEN